MYIIGITGPSGAGKTTALRVLEALGGRVFDCDAVYHALLRTDGELLGRIEAAFPGAVKDYALDRKALGARVFADPAGLETLTAITQPIVAKRVLEEINRTSKIAVGAHSVRPDCPEQTAQNAGAHCAPLQQDGSVSSSPIAYCPLPVASFAVIDAIGLFESGLGEQCDLTVAVVADPETRVRRLMARDGVSEDYARARIAAQKPAEFYTAQAALVLENNGAEAEFAQKCRAVFQTILRQRM